MLRVLAVDGELPALDELLSLLRDDPRVASVDSARDATGALRRLGKALDGPAVGVDAIDLVFLEVHLAGLSGLELARLVAGFPAPPRIVFVSAHERFALQAFDVEAVDYLLKPLSRPRFSEAVRRVAELVEADRGARADGADPPAPAPPSPAPAELAEYVPVEREGVTRFLAVADITYAEAHGDHSRLHTRRESHLVRIPLSALQEHWRARGFVRIHRRHLVSVASIDEVRVAPGSLTVRIGVTELAVSRRSARELRGLLLRGTTGDRSAHRP